MEFSIFIKKMVGGGLIAGAIIFCGFPLSVGAQFRKSVTYKETKLDNRNFISAFATPIQTGDSLYAIYNPVFHKGYTIQVCTLDHAVPDHFFKGGHKIRIIRMGDLYRYIFSQYATLDEARKALLMIRRIYPDACIREYNQGLLGQVVDMNIDHYKNK